MNPELGEIGRQAVEAEEMGYAALLSAEIGHDPFMPLAIAAEHTERIQLATGIAVGLSRSPVHLAHAAHDLQRFSKGRFILGVGSQIRAHIEKRFSATWSEPTERMKDLIGAVRAIWRTWDEGVPLRYEGPFYRHTLMTPFFSPPRNPYGPPPIYLAASGPEMTMVGGEVADGLMLHALTSIDTLREITLPALRKGLAASGRSRGDVDLYAPVFVITGDTDEEMETADRAVRLQLAFYASTPAYTPGPPLPRLRRPARASSTPCPSRAAGRTWAASSATTSSTCSRSPASRRSSAPPSWPASAASSTGWPSTPPTAITPSPGPGSCPASAAD